MRVLVAEDDRESMRLVASFLKRWDYEVVPVDTGAKALSILRGNDPPLLALLDWNMPELDGLQVVERLRADTSKDYIYTIMLTARSDRKDMLRGLGIGADDYVKKPFDKEELRARLLAGERVVHLKQELEAQNKTLQALNRDLEKANQRMQKDLQTAAEFQRSLLPTDLPDLPGIEFAWRYEPCEELAGDLLNVFWLDDDHLALYLLDVSGHGVSASFLTGSLSRVISPIEERTSLVRTRLPGAAGYQLTRPSKVAAQLSEQFDYDRESQKYFTLLYGVFKTQTNEMCLVSAGHPRPLLVRDGKHPKSIEVRGLPIGFMKDADYQEARITLQQGDRLYLFSDGLPEAMNSAGELFGERRLRQALSRERAATLKDTLDAVFQEIENWTGGQTNDDLSILALNIQAVA